MDEEFFVWKKKNHQFQILCFVGFVWVLFGLVSERTILNIFLNFRIVVCDGGTN